ncbi:MAG: M12 family metallopeptidase [Acidobacteriota bacterium]
MRYLLTLILPAFLAAQAVPEVRAILLDGQPVRYVTQDGYAIVRGDIILGSIAELESAAKGEAAGLNRIRAASISNSTLWTAGTIPYIIDADVPNTQRILDGIAHWQTRTQLKIVPRGGEANYVRFKRVTADFACTSALGMRGGEQLVQTTDVCTTGNIIHELGHAFGLLHEQERLDRNQYVTVLYENVDKRFLYAFDQVSSSRDSSYYDYDSIMHYPPSGFTRNGLDSLETVPVGIPIGQRLALSPADIDQISRLYGFKPTLTTITTMPAGLPVIVDGQPITAPQSFNWTPGSTHTVSVNPRQGDDPLYSLVRWTDGGAAQHDVKVSADQSVIAAIFQVLHKVTTQVSTGTGTVSLRPASADGYYPDRLPVLVEATPANGFNFTNWNGNTNFSANGYGISAAKAVLDVDRVGIRYNANFTTSAVTTITSDPVGRTVMVDTTNYVTPINLVLAAGPHTLNLVATQTDGNNTVRYKFTGWADGSTAASRTFTAGSPVSAKFTTQYLLTTSVIGTGTVTASPTSTDGFYDLGSQVTLSAPGQSIRYWLGDAAGGANSQTVVMDEQRSATAVFSTPLTFRLVSAASYLATNLLGANGTQVAPYEIVTLFGANLGPATLVSGVLDGSGRLATSLGNTRILFDGTPAPIVYAYATQTSFVVPGNVAPKTSATMSVERNGVVVSGSQVLAITATKPALFTANASGKGPVAAFNQDGSVNSPTNPADANSVVVLYGSGAGLLDRALLDGEIMDANLARPVGPVVVKFGKLPGEIFYAGSAPFLVNGALQVNVRVPKETLPGLVPLQLSVGTWTSPPGTTIAVR